MFNFCPSCASKNINVEKDRVFRCPDCGFVYFQNVAAATGCIISMPEADGEKLLVSVRGKDPGKGLMDIPGGFIDPGEGAYEGLYRELREEIGWTPSIPPGKNLADIFTLYASFPNIYLYKGVNYNTCDLYFKVSAPGLTLQDLRPQQIEITELLLLKPDEIDINKFAFESTKHAIRAYFNQ